MRGGERPAQGYAAKSQKEHMVPRGCGRGALVARSPVAPRLSADPPAAPAAPLGASSVSGHPARPPSSVWPRFLPSTGAGESCRCGPLAPAPLLLDLSATPAGVP